MASRERYGRWSLGWPLLGKAAAVAIAAVLLFVAVYSVGLFGPSSSPAVASTKSEPAQTPDPDAVYAGSIIVTPASGDKCLDRKFDNRTGRMWDNGYINCDTVVRAEPAGRQAMGVLRMRAIGKALRHED